MTYKDFNFPFNVWAYILEREGSSIENFHFGLFDKPNDSVLTAQMRINEFIYDRLPAPPARVTEVGTGFGYMINDLLQRGYHVTGVNPDATQVKLAQQTYNALTEIDFHAVKFEEYRCKNPGDALIFLESSQYIDIEYMFSTARNCLVPGGVAIIIDEMRVAEVSDESVHAVGHYDKLAAESGFVLDDQEDLSDRAAPSVDFVIRCFYNYREDILRELPVTPEVLDSAIVAWERSRDKFADGRRKYFYKRYHLAD